MADREIPLEASAENPYFTQTAQLDGRNFTFEFNYQEVSSAWYWSLLDGDQARVISGLSVVTNVSALGRFQTAAFPPGHLIFLDLTDGGPPGRNDLGKRVKLFYVDSDGVDL